LNIVHLCDAPEGIPTDEESLVHTSRDERLYVGEGAIDMKSIVARMPHAVRGIEIPHLKRVANIGIEEHARKALLSAKSYLKDL
jgi:sugar phosphate isomerase/epimerase